MPTNPEQGSLELDDTKPSKETHYDREITLGHARKQISGEDRRTPTPTDPLLVGATEVPQAPEPKQLPPHTHTVATGREVWCLDSNPGRAPFATRTTETLRLAATGQTRLVALRKRLPEYVAPDPFATHREGKLFDHLRIVWSAVD